MKPENIPAYLTWFGLGGYALIAPVSIAISQLFFGISLAGFIAYILAARDRSQLIFPPVTILVVIVAYVAWRLLAGLIVGADMSIIREEWLFLMIVVAAVLLRDMVHFKWILDIFTAGVIVMGGYGIWQHFVGIDLYHGVLLDRMFYGYRAIGTFSTYLTYSGFFAVASMFLVSVAFMATSGWRKFYYLAASQIGLAGVLFNYSRSTILAFFIGIVILVLLIGARYRKWVSLILLLTIAVALVISPDFMSRFRDINTSDLSVGSANSRIAIWSTSLAMIEQEPVFGVGPGNFAQKYIDLRENRKGRNLSHAHNDILNIAAESGIPCMLIYLLLWVLIMAKLYTGYRKCPEGFQKGLLLGALVSSVVFFIMSQFEAFFADEEVRLLLMFIWGIGLAVRGNMKASEHLSEIA